MSSTTRAILVLTLATSLSTVAEELPSYKADVEAFRQKRPQKSNISEEDMAVLTQSAKDLDAALPAPGLNVGDTAPDFTLPGANGQNVTLSKALESGPVVLTFYRGGWCPYCNLELQALGRSLPAIKAHNAQVLAITPQTTDRSEAQASEEKLSFPLLSDLTNKVMKDYNLHFELSGEADAVYRDSFGIDVAAYNGDKRRDLPVPGTFVIGQDGIVKAAFADTDYKNRMEPAEIIKALESLK